MKRSVLTAMLLVAIGCNQKKEFKGSTATGQKRAEDVKAMPLPTPQSPEQPKPTLPLPVPSPVMSEVIHEENATPGLRDGSQDFSIDTTTSKEVDMYWVIDNSDSMSEEVAQVRTNLEKFMDSISNRVDIKLSLISKASGEYGVSLGSKAITDGHKQIDIDVQSYNGLNLLASALCPADTTAWSTNITYGGFASKATWKMVVHNNIVDRETDSSPYKICGVLSKYELEMKELLIYSDLQRSGLIGAHKPRADAAKVIVIVSDDDPITSLDAASLGKDLGFAPGSLHLFGFIGKTSQPGCRISRPGIWYEKAATATGGQTFDICEKDWTANFSKLSEKVVEVSTSTFTLAPKKNLMVKSVLIDGTEIPLSAYAVSGTSVKITNSTLLKGAKSLRVNFSYQI